MALPSSGPLSIGDIRTELGSSSGSLRTLSAAAGKSTPDAISEFYGYPPSPVPTPTPTPVPTPAPVPTAPVPVAPPTAPPVTDPTPTAPVPTAPVPTAPVPTAPVPTAPVPTAPVPTAPVPTAPAPVAYSGSINPQTIAAFTPGTASSYTVYVTANTSWTLDFTGGARGYFTVSPSSGSSGTAISVNLAYGGSNSWTSDGGLRLKSASPVQILFNSTIEYTN